MKSFLTPAYTFVPGASGVGTLDLSAIPVFDMKKLVAVINQTDGILIYSTASLTKGFTTEAAGVVTLQFDTSSMSGADKLQIIYEDLGQKPRAESSPVVLSTEQEAKLDNILSELQLKANITDTQPVSFAPGAGGASDATLIEVRDLSGVIAEDESVMDAAASPLTPGTRTTPRISEYGMLYTRDLWLEDTIVTGNSYLDNISDLLTARIPVFLGQNTSGDSLGVVLSTSQEVILSAIKTASEAVLTELLLKAKITDTQPVSASSLPLPSGAATSVLQASSELVLDDSLTQLGIIAGKLPGSVGQKAMAASLAVVISSDQSALSTTQTALTGTFQEDLTVGAGAETFTAPAGAKWCKIQADDTNTVNIRIKIGGTATASSGHQFQPGRSEDFQVSGNISYISESTTGQKLCVTFGA